MFSLIQYYGSKTVQYLFPNKDRLKKLEEVLNRLKEHDNEKPDKPVEEKAKGPRPIKVSPENFIRKSGKLEPNSKKCLHLIPFDRFFFRHHNQVQRQLWRN
jgi:hypothetical protein